MSDPTSIFNGTPQGTPANNTPGGTPAASQNGALTTLLGMIKNEKGEQKYATVEDALVGLKNAQDYIPTLKEQLTAKEREAAEALEKAKKVAELEATVLKLTQQNSTPSATNTPGFTEEQVAEIATRALKQQQEKATQVQNLQTVTSALAKQFGAEAEAKFYGKAQELGMSKEEINLLASKSPVAVLTLFGVKDTPAQPNRTGLPTPTSINSDGVQPHVDTAVTRNSKPIIVGATSEELTQERANAVKMVEELHAQGKSVHDLTDPKVFFKTFGKH